MNVGIEMDVAKGHKPNEQTFFYFGSLIGKYAYKQVFIDQYEVMCHFGQSFQSTRICALACPHAGLTKRNQSIHFASAKLLRHASCLRSLRCCCESRLCGTHLMLLSELQGKCTTRLDLRRKQPVCSFRKPPPDKLQHLPEAIVMVQCGYNSCSGVAGS